MSLSDSLPKISQFKIDSVDISDAAIQLYLQAGIKLNINLSEGRYINIKNLNEVELNNWCLTDDGCGIYWPAVSRPEKFSKAPMIDAIERVWDIASDRVLTKASSVNWDLSSLSDVDQQIVSLWRMEADIYNGGFMQFFCNWGEQTCQLAISSLANIGANQAQSIVSRMREIISRIEPQVNDLMDIYRLTSDSERKEMEELDEAYWENPDQLVTRIVNYYAEYFKDLVRNS